MAIIKPNNNTLSAVTALPAAIPTGKILQVSNFIQTSSGQTISSSTYTDVTSLTLNITPSATSSKIFLSSTIQAELNVNSGDRGYSMQFLRDSTAVYTTSGAYTVYFQSGGQNYTFYNFSYIDSPNTTSQITYKVQIKTNNGDSIPLNAPAQSNMYAMEIAG